MSGWLAAIGKDGPRRIGGQQLLLCLPPAEYENGAAENSKRQLLTDWWPIMVGNGAEMENREGLLQKDNTVKECKWRLFGYWPLVMRGDEVEIEGGKQLLLYWPPAGWEDGAKEKGKRQSGGDWPLAMVGDGV